MTNQGDVKQVEKDIIRELLKGEGDKVNVADFKKKVQAELLPLKATSSLDGEPRYENITLPEDVRGEVQDYSENVYNSPIETSAGQVHFSGEGSENYFGHTRIEDMADDETRRVIEVQSDLYQKGNLEKELGMPKKAEYNGKEYTVGGSRNGLTWLDELGMDVKTSELKLIYDESKLKDVSKLSQYNDPTAHFRMIREEIKKAADDGITKLQFPTGETAMRIEGLAGDVGYVPRDSVV